MPPVLPSCSVCQTTLDPNGTCPRCRAPEDWNDRIEALDFLVRRLKDWHRDGQLTDRQLGTLTEHYDKQRSSMAASSAAKEPCQPTDTCPPRDECWSCNEYLYANSSHCAECGAPITHPAVKSLRYYRYLFLELQANEESGLLTLRQSHEFLSDTKERIRALKSRLERERAPMVIPVAPNAPPPPKRRRVEPPPPRTSEYDNEPEVEAGPRRSFLEVILDPQSIQWLLLAGGMLIVVGIVIWLASLGVFAEPVFIATALGIGNAVLVAGGWLLMLRTRYQHAGRALTLLACLIMPLNLWFYHTHKLLTLEDHLWIAALGCCIVYAASAYVLKDGLFVYVLVAGITLTGLLVLAQMSRFGEIAAPVTLLIILGLICLHAERAFPEIEGPFSRRDFGMAFYWSSQFLFAVGLLLLLGAQVIGWLHGPIFRHLIARPDVSTREFLPWTLALVLAGTYAYIYSDLVVRRIGVYLYLAAITLIWAEIHVLVLTGMTDQEAIVMITLAVTALAINLFQVQFESNQTFLRVLPPLAVLLSSIPVMLGVLLHFRAVNSVLNQEWPVIDGNNRSPFVITWGLAGATAVVALCCRAGAYLYRRKLSEVSVFYFFLTGAATLVFAAELTWLLHDSLRPWQAGAPIVMLVPILYLVAAYLYEGHTPQRPLIWVAHTATAIMIFCTLWTSLGITAEVVVPIQGEARNLLLSLFCLEVAIFYALASFLRRSNWTMYLSAVMLCGAFWQLMIAFNTPHEYYTVAFSLIGFVLLVVYRLGIFERFEMPSLERAVFQSANALMTLGFVAGALLSLSRFFLREHELARLDPAGDWRSPVAIMRNLLILLTLISIASACIVQNPVWRRVHIVLTIINGILLFLMIHKLSVLSPWQKLEIFSLIVGVLLLGLGHLGWYRETEKQSDLVSIALFLGAGCLVLPLLIATIAFRVQHHFTPGWDDLGVVVAGILLLVSGIFCRIQSTTLIGAVGLTAYLIVILVSLHRHLKDAWIIGIYLTLGGVLLFGTGIILSVYRDNLLALPGKIKRREGIFRFFDWR